MTRFDPLAIDPESALANRTKARRDGAQKARGTSSRTPRLTRPFCGDT
jgi:hypothetical protein